METQLWALGILLLSTVVGAGGPILLKQASNRLNREAFASITKFFGATAFNFKLVFGIGLYAVGLILYIIALAGADLSVLYPLVSLAYIWVCILSVIVLKEKMTALKWSGVLLIVAGAVLVGLGS